MVRNTAQALEIITTFQKDIEIHSLNTAKSGTQKRARTLKTLGPSVEENESNSENGRKSNSLPEEASTVGQSPTLHRHRERPMTLETRLNELAKSE